MTTKNTRAAIGLCAILATASCAGPTRTVHETSNQDDTETYRSEATIHKSKGRADLENGRDAAMRGDYAGAIDDYLDVYRSSSASAEHKAEALLALGDLHRNPLYPRHDDATALMYYQKLIDEFPGSELRPKAEQGVKETGPAPAPGAVPPR